MKKRVLGLILFACGIGMLLAVFLPGTICLFVIGIICIILGCLCVRHY